MTNIDVESVLIDMDNYNGVFDGYIMKNHVKEIIRKHTDHFSLTGKMGEQPVAGGVSEEAIRRMIYEEVAKVRDGKGYIYGDAEIMDNIMDKIRPYLKQPTLADETLREALQEIYSIYDNAEDLQTIRALKQAAFIAEIALKGQLPKQATLTESDIEECPECEGGIDD